MEYGKVTENEIVEILAKTPNLIEEGLTLIGRQVAFGNLRVDLDRLIVWWLTRCALARGVYPTVYFGEPPGEGLIKKRIVVKGYFREGKLRISKFYVPRV
jgi:hypothetical protein